MTRRSTVALVACLLAVMAPMTAGAQTVQAKPATDRVGSRLWIVGGGGFSVGRAGCATCDRAGVFTNSRSILIDAGVRVSPRVDAGVELFWVSSKIVDGDPIRTTFILGLAQFRPWVDRGLFLRAGMGMSFVGNGLYSPIGPALAPPFSTNALGVSYGLGWVFRRNRRWTIQTNATHHVAAIGELTTTTGTTVNNIVGNYWTVGTAVVIR